MTPIAWNEGMFLRPQHFQQRDLYEQEARQFQLDRVHPFNWGVRELVFNEEALAEALIEIQSLEAVLPGGTILRFPGNTSIAPRKFDPEATEITVYLGMTRLSPVEANAAADAGAPGRSRYVIESEEVPDLNRGGFPGGVEYARPHVRVLFGNEGAEIDACESIRIGVVRATGEPTAPFRLDVTQSPPLLAVQSWPPLFDEITKIVSQIAGKVRVLAGRTATIAVADLPRMWMRYTLARMTPTLCHLLSVGETQPFLLYSALVETAGALAAFRREEAVEVPTYDHDDPYSCFKALIDLIDEELSAAVPDQFTELLLEWDGAVKAYRSDGLSLDLVDPRNHYYLAVQADMDTAELTKLVVDQGKAGSVDGVSTLVLLNVKGLRIEHLSGAPTEIAARAGYEYFRVDPHGAQWNKVRDEFNFALNLGKLENATARLYIVAAGGS